MIIKKNRLVEIIKEELARFEEVANMGADVNPSYKEGIELDEEEPFSISLEKGGYLFFYASGA